MLDDGEAIMVLEPAPHFQQSLLRGEATSVQLQVDATNSVIGFLASSYAAQIIGQYGLEAGLAREGLRAADIDNVPRIDSRHRVWFIVPAGNEFKIVPGD
jgi:ABC-2 type transport system permease protein